MIVCTFPKDINRCEYYDEKNSFCNNPNKCSYQEDSERVNVVQKKYIRQERWYEKYYRK